MNRSTHAARGAFLGVVVLSLTVLSCSDAGITSTDPFAAVQLRLDPADLELDEGTQAQVRASFVDAAGKPLPEALRRFRFSWTARDTSLVQVAGANEEAWVSAVGGGDSDVDVAAIPLNGSGTITASVRVRSRYVAAKVVIVSGNNQRGVVGRALPAELVVRVLNRDNKAIMGARVDFVAASNSGAANLPSVYTDIGGYARTIWTLGADTGQHTLEARVSNVSPAGFAATAVAASPTALTVVSGASLQGVAGQSAGTALQVRAADSNGQPIRGATVSWLIVSGGGSISPATSVTDLNGNASAQWTFGPVAGTQVARATLGSLATDFSAQVAAAAPSQIVKASGDAQSGTAGAPLSDSLTVRVLDVYGNNVPGAAVTWAVTSGGGSVSPAQGTTNTSGTTATSWRLGSSAGSGSVRASIANGNNLTFTATALTVNAPPPAPVVNRVDLTPATLSLDAIGAQGILSAASYDANNQAVPGTQFAWTSLNSAIATVDTTGRVTARGVGTVLVIAAALCCGHADTAAVTVTQRVASIVVSPRTLALQTGGAADVSVVAKDANNNVVAAPAVTWSSSNQSVATVASGRVSAVAAGTAVVRAVSGTVRDSVVVTVQNPPPAVSSVVLTPASVTLDALGAQVSLAAVAYDGGGQVALGAQIGWSTLSSNIATVDSTGRVTAKSVGTALIVATALCCNVADTTSVVITQRVASVAISPRTLSVQAGAAGTLSVTARDANQNLVPSPSITWSSSNTATATVSSQGSVQGISAGSAFIRAVSGTAKDSVSVTVTSSTTSPSALTNECSAPQSGWIWCDDFSVNRLSSYFEYDNAGGRFVLENGVGVNGSAGMRATFTPGQVGAGSMKLAFGQRPSTYFRAVDAGTAQYRDVYWRVFVRNEPGWTGGGGEKLSRAIVFANSNWAEAAIGHVWSGASTSNYNYLLIDPASGTDTQGTLRTTGYNDFPNLRWLGAKQSTTPIFSGTHIGQWQCVETRMRLNDAGQSNGVFELWINGVLEAQSTGLNWLGSFSSYAINAIFLENYWSTNGGTPKQQSRYFDNLVVSTQRIGCGSAVTTAPAPVASVTVTPATATLAVGATQQLVATTKDALGNTLTGRSVSWSSSNTGVATVSSSGLVTARAAGSATIRATSEGVTGTAAATVTSSTTTSAAPNFVEDFSTYSSTTNMLGNPRDIYGAGAQTTPSEDINTRNMILDTSTGFGGTGRSMRYEYPAGSTSDYTVSRTIDFRRPSVLGRELLEVWVEYAVRFSTNFTLRTNTTINSAGLKVHQLLTFPNSRFGLQMESSDDGTLRFEGPGDVNYSALYLATPIVNKSLFDGQWHVIRHHVRIDPVGNTDFHEAWVDGVYQGSRTGATNVTSMWGFKLAANLSMLPPSATHMWWGKVSFWTQNPGW